MGPFEPGVGEALEWETMKRKTLNEYREALEAAPGPTPELLEELRNDARAGAQALYRRHAKQMARAAAETERLALLWRFEEEAMSQGFRRVAGVDEAGRGPLAGPIVAGAVVLAGRVAGLNDSKQLTADQRAALFEILSSGGHDIGVGIVDAATIDRIGIQPANYRAMAEAAQALDVPPDFLLVDGFRLPGVATPHKRIVKGDSRSLSIAAASIVAKVTRDRMMARIERDYPGYGFGKHKGYATREHLDALAARGPCAVHRKSFAPIARATQTASLFDEEGDVALS